MSSDNTQESLQAFTPCLNDLIGEAVRKHLPRKKGDVDTSGFTFQDITESFKVTVSATNAGVPQLESRDVCLSGESCGQKVNIRCIERITDAH